MAMVPVLAGVYKAQVFLVACIGQGFMQMTFAALENVARLPAVWRLQ